LLFCAKGDDEEEIHFLIDRKNDYYFVTGKYKSDDRKDSNHPWRGATSGIHLPHHGDREFKKFHENTLFDGELVLDHERDGVVLRYLVFDCMVLDGEDLTQKPFDKRIGRFQEFVYKPLKTALRRYPEEIQYFPFEILFKQMDKPYALHDMFLQKLPNLPHGNDGLIFTCKETPYVMGTDEHILKWKPAHENSIDFRLKLGSFPTMIEDGDEMEDFDGKPNFELEVFYGNTSYGDFATLYIDDADWAAMKHASIRDRKPLDGRIIECWLEQPAYGESRWRFKRENDGTPRFRDDKHDANHISTVEKVIQSIEDAVSQEDLIAHEYDIMKAWKRRHPEEEAAKRRQAEAARAGPPRAPPQNGHT